MKKEYKCFTCRDIGMIKEGISVVTVISYPGGDKACSFVEPQYWDYKDCPACLGKSWEDK